MTANLAQIVDSWEATVNHAGWKVCPLCHKEWSKLNSCTYFQDGQERVALACIRCSEGVRALPEINALIPSPGAKIEVLQRRMYRNHPIALSELPSAHWATVEYSGMNFKIEPISSGKLKVTYSGDMENPKFYDNIFQAWMAVNTQIEKGDVQVKTTGWEKVKPIRERRNKGLLCLLVILIAFVWIPCPYTNGDDNSYTREKIREWIIKKEKEGLTAICMSPQGYFLFRDRRKK